MDKKKKWSKNRKRLHDALISNVYNNNQVQMLENFALLKPDEFESCKSNLLRHSLKNASKECAQILIDRGATCDPSRIIYDCDWRIVDKVYLLVNELISINDNKFLKTDSRFLSNNKKAIIARLIEPYKVEANVERVEYVLRLLREEFFTVQDIREVYSNLYKDNHKGKMVMLLRELTLNELGI